MEGINYPTGGEEADDDQKEDWATDAEQLLTEQSVVPEANSLHSFAIAWRYERQVRASKRRRTVTISHREQ